MKSSGQGTHQQLSPPYACKNPSTLRLPWCLRPLEWKWLPSTTTHKHLDSFPKYLRQGTSADAALGHLWSSNSLSTFSYVWGAAVPVWNGDRYTSKIFEENKQKSPNPKQTSCLGFFCLNQRLCHLVMSSLLISLVDGILQGKGSGGSMQELIPSILNANTSLIQKKKKGYREVFSEQKTN